MEQEYCLFAKCKLFAKLIKDGEIVDYGLVSTKKVTQAFIEYIVDSLQNSTSAPMDVFKYHDSGTGTNGESNADTALQTPTGVARATGTQIEGAAADQYKTVATITYDGSYAVTEHGVFSASSSGTLMDRSVFSAINVENGNQIEFTYQIEFTPEA